MRKTKMYIVAILPCIILLHFYPFISIFRGKAAMLKKEGSIEVVIDGRCITASFWFFQVFCGTETKNRCRGDGKRGLEVL